jgi:threonine dehydratase
MHKTIKNIVNSIENTRVYEVISPTKLDFATNLSWRFNNNIYLKREDTTLVHSFKIRGAYQKITSLSNEQLANGVITASAGNHAQGVALSAQKLGIDATIFMPLNTPKIKVDAVENLGGKVVLQGDVYDETQAFALQFAQDNTITFIPPYDDCEVMAGQGTIAKEIVDDLPDVDMIFVPVGGGGLLGGILSYIKTIKPSIKVIGVEPKDIPTLFSARQNNSRTTLQEIGRFADGVAVKQIGEQTFEVTKDLVDDVLLVSNDEICAAIKDIYNDTRGIAEPSGALATAGIKKYLETHHTTNSNLVAIVSGGNVNFDRLRYVAERAEIGEKSEVIFAATINEQPGSFLQFCNALQHRNITEFNYRFADSKEAHIFVGVAIDEHGKEELFANLQDFHITDLSDNSIAKTHIRYMVGGKANTGDEVLYRFEFPERPGALLDFLTGISGKYNISLFHYRNHGSAYGRVLVGFQTADTHSLEQVLDSIGYIYFNETNNPAYQFFL